MEAFVKELFCQVLQTLGGAWLCVVLCIAVVTVGAVVVAVVHQTIGRKPMIEWITKLGTGRLTFPTADKK